MSLILDAEEKILTDYLQKGARITEIYYASLIKSIQKSKNHQRRIFLDNYYRQPCLV
jgi:hypothetical protein